MRDITAELKALRLHGMAGAWIDLKAQGGLGIDTSGWLGSSQKTEFKVR